MLLRRQRNNDREYHEIYERYLAGEKCRALADAFRCSTTKIHEAIKSCHQNFIEAKQWHVEHIKLEHTERYMLIYAKAMADYELSKETKIGTEERYETRFNQEDGSEYQKPYREKSITIPGKADAALLGAAMKALESIEKMWGAHAPVKNEHSGSISTGVGFLTREQMDIELVSRLERIGSAVGSADKLPATQISTTQSPTITTIDSPSVKEIENEQDKNGQQH
jgi:hypothetical protein